MTIRVEVKSIQSAVTNAGRALSEKYRDQYEQYGRDYIAQYGQYNTEESQRFAGMVIPQQWRSEYDSDVILEWHTIREFGMFMKYVDFESEQDYAFFLLRWS